jgi:hypothetical protein
MALAAGGYQPGAADEGTKATHARLEYCLVQDELN